MVLKFPCCLAHWHHILLLFHFGRMCRSRNQNCYCKCCCNWKIFHFGRMLWSWKYHCCHWSPRAQIGFLCTVAVPQVCLHHCETSPHWSWYQSLSQRIFLFGRMCWSHELQYFRLLYCLFHFGRVYWCHNEQCYWWWCCRFFELGIGPMVELVQWYCWEGLFRLVAFSRAHH